MVEEEYTNTHLDTFTYHGRDYKIPGYDQTGVRQEVDKRVLPPRLYRVFEAGSAKFDHNKILQPINPKATNDMVSLASENDWPKFARLNFFRAQSFKVLTINTAELIGPTFAVGNAIFEGDEILALVPSKAIQEVRTFTWEAMSSHPAFPAVEDLLIGSYGQDLYQRMTARTKGWELQLLKTEIVPQE